MKKIVVLFVVFSLIATAVLAEDLSDYPNAFKKGSTLDVITVVGDKAPATHVLAQTQIALALSSEVNRQVPGLTRLASEIDRIENINLISIGNACDNPITAEILNNPSPCNDGLSPDTATIESYENDNGRIHIVLNAYGDVAVRELADVLVNYDDFPLNGNRFEKQISGEQERTFDTSKKQEETPEPVVINEEPEVEDEKEEESVQEEVVETQTADTNQEQQETTGSNTLDIDDEQPEPLLKNNDNVVLRFFSWLKGLFGFR